MMKGHRTLGADERFYSVHDTIESQKSALDKRKLDYQGKWLIYATPESAI